MLHPTNQQLIHPSSETLSRTEEGSWSCDKFWDSNEARFTHCIIPYLSLVACVVSLSLYGLRLSDRFLRRFRPCWLERFVSEERDVTCDTHQGVAKSFSWYPSALVALAMCGTISQVLQISLSSWKSASGWLGLVAWLVLLVWSIHERPRSFQVGLLINNLVLFLSNLIQTTFVRPPVALIAVMSITLLASFLTVVLLLVIPFRNPVLAKANIAKSPQNPTHLNRSPEDDLSLWEFMTVKWVGTLIQKATEKRLDGEDVWQLPWEFQHTRLHSKFRELKGSVTGRLLHANGIDLVFTTMLGSVEMVANLAQPVLNQHLLRSLQDEEAPRTAAITYAALVLVTRLVASQASLMNLWFSRRCYERSRGEMITMLYEKTLNRKLAGLKLEDASPGRQQDPHVETHVTSGKPHLSSFSRLWRWLGIGFNLNPPNIPGATGPASTGKILNLMRNDVYEVAQRFWEFPAIFTKPLGLILSVLLAWKLLGWSCLLGIAVLVLGAIVTGVITSQMLKIEKHRRKTTDRKLQITSQFVEAIRHLRWYGWTGSWLAKIVDARRVELKLRLIVRSLQLAVSCLNYYCADLFPIAAFFAYTKLEHKPLRLEIAFPALQLLSILQNNLRELPGLVLVLLNAFIAMDRIEEFMREPEKQKESRGISRASERLEMIDASYAWPGRYEAVLVNINLEIPVGLTVVYGRVAAGKSALLQAFLGELDKLGGFSVVPDEMIGYCGQSPWLQSMSIRDNILFSSPYEETRYHQVLDACQLTSDLASFKSGDSSIIGENGIGLSGGQKSRVALARAIYSRADILLLDDPISALDQQTAEKLIKACFSGPLMKKRRVVLATHRTDLCQSYAEKMVEVINGHIKVHERSHDCDLVVSNVEAELQKVDDVDKSGPRGVAAPSNFIEEEGRAHGGVRFSVYWEYIKAGKLKWWAAMIIATVAARLSYLAQYWFLKQWGEAYNKSHLRSHSYLGEGLLDRLPSPELDVTPWLLGMFSLATTASLSLAFSMMFFLPIVYISGRAMFNNVMDRVSHAKFRFYDVTPVGRLMNRLTSDISTLDGEISLQLALVAIFSISWISSLLVIGSISRVFVIFAFIIATGFAIVFRRFLPGSQSLRRLEMVSLSPLMSNFGTLLEGLATVRAFKAQARFQTNVIEVVDNFQKMDHFYWSLQAWLQCRFDALAASSTFFLTLLAIWTGISPGLTAFALLSAEQFIRATHDLCKEYGRLQLEFVSVERIVELMHLERESPGSNMPPAIWPSCSGDIVFENATLRYAPHLDPTLKSLSFTIKGGSSTAIIGRTGSGKSTLAQALLATIMPESGHIFIDGIDINLVDKQSLRSRITFIAQEPVLFPGTLRHNLDPTGEVSDDECRSVLERINPGHTWTLDMEIDTGGRNLSQGQRQLVGLARVILRRSAIVILDEATASIDIGTAMRAQEILRQELQQSTVITIAHRLEAVREASHCVVLEDGRVIEQGDARNMLNTHKD